MKNLNKILRNKLSTEKTKRKNICFTYIFKVSIFLKKSSCFQQWFKHLGDDNGVMTLDRLNNLTRDEIRTLVLELEGTDLTNTLDHEYGYVDQQQIR